jgi:hypothetical protein
LIPVSLINEIENPVSNLILPTPPPKEKHKHKIWFCIRFQFKIKLDFSTVPGNPNRPSFSPFSFLLIVCFCFFFGLWLLVFSFALYFWRMGSHHWFLFTWYIFFFYQLKLEPMVLACQTNYSPNTSKNLHSFLCS